MDTHAGEAVVVPVVLAGAIKLWTSGWSMTKRSTSVTAAVPSSRSARVPRRTEPSTERSVAGAVVANSRMRAIAAPSRKEGATTTPSRWKPIHVSSSSA